MLIAQRKRWMIACTYLNYFEDILDYYAAEIKKLQFSLQPVFASV
jgi:hypothetical protein